MILSGHQPSFFHAGILAKRIALDKRAQSEATPSAWLLADQDINEPGVIEYPDLDDAGTLVRRSWHATTTQPGVPTFARTREVPTRPPRVSSDLPTCIQLGLEQIFEALREADGSTLAEQYHTATESLLGDLVTQPCTLIKSSTLLETTRGQEALEKIVRAPIACAQTWNDAVETVQRSARKLRIHNSNTSKTEAPVWKLDEHNRRQRGTVGDIQAHLEGKARVYPRAFLMTAIARADLCSEMIHGIGGGVYEEVTQLWAESFLGFQLAPISVVTATARLPLNDFVEPVPDCPTAEEIRRIEHNPWPDPTEKHRWIEQIQNAPFGSNDRQRLFLEMHQTMHELRKPAEQKIAAMKRARREAEKAIAQSRIAHDRTWPWPLLEHAALQDLHLEVR